MYYKIAKSWHERLVSSYHLHSNSRGAVNFSLKKKKLKLKTSVSVLQRYSCARFHGGDQAYDKEMGCTQRFQKPKHQMTEPKKLGVSLHHAPK